MGRSHGLGLPRSLVVSVQHPSKRRPAPIEELECRQRSLVEVCIQMHEREKAVAQRIRSGRKQTRMIMHPLRSDVPAHVLEVRLEFSRSEEHTSELQSPCNLVCRLLLEKKKIESMGSESDRINHCICPTTTDRDDESSCVVRNRIRCPVSIVWRARFFFFNDSVTTEIFPLSLHDALRI